MRHRTVKGKEEVFAASSEWMVTDPMPLRGNWQSLFEKERPISLEIGSGKGQFLCAMAEAHPERNFLACEGLPDVYLRIIEKIRDRQIRNLRVICAWMKEPAACFAEGEIDRLYINFCDPWPKKRHTKRRLTNRMMLAQYEKILVPGGILEFKTDNDDLFDFSLDEFKAAGFELLAMTRDLHMSPYAAENVPTEYEDKFAGSGKSINFARVRVR